MRRLTITVLMVSALVAADRAFGFQQAGALAPENAPVLTARQADRERTAGAVTAHGSLECSAVCDVRCEVSSPDEGGTPILEILPEGKLVEEGQVLVKLDASGLEEQETRQRILCAASEAAVVQAASEHEVALVELEECKEGVSKLMRLECQLAIFVAKEQLCRAKQELEESEELAERKLIPERQLEGARFAVAKAEKELELAETRLEVLEKYSYPKMLKQLESKVRITKARYESESQSHRLGLDRLRGIESQIEKCVIKAPVAGRIVYAPPPRIQAPAAGPAVAAPPTLRRVEAGPLIGRGARVHHGQPILSIQDPRKMQLTVVSPGREATHVEPGFPATIRVDAFPDLELRGVVTQIGLVETPPRPRGSPRTITGCRITVRVVEPPDELRPGMTAQVTIPLGGA